MTDIDTLRGALAHFAQMDEESFNLSKDCWRIRTYKKGDIYNPVGSICRYLGFTMEGYFRAYLFDKHGFGPKHIAKACRELARATT